MDLNIANPRAIHNYAHPSEITKSRRGLPQKIELSRGIRYTDSMRIAMFFSVLLLVRNGFPEGLSPAEEQKTFQLEPNLKVELVAAEPMVVAPVAIAFDEQSRMFVAENRGYPTGPGLGQPPAGKIALLEDKNRDGVYETRTDFAEGLTFPNGVLPWKGGVFVTCAPDLLYLKDTDGDGKADERKVVFTGFATTGSTQLRVCSPTLAPDCWIYMNGGLSGGKVTSPDFPGHPPVDMTHNDFRFRPGDWSVFEPTDGKGQFGLAFDDAGHRFFCMNRVHVQHVVTESRYWKRNPRLAFSETVQDCPESMMPEPLKGHRSAARIYPISHNITTADSHAGTFTAACGLVIYNGNALPPEMYGNSFVCDPTGNLVHRDQLIPSGATFLARRSEKPTEFFAAADDWCRPVNLAVGPDGALYICDMYRKTIEHPDYLPEEIRKRTDFESGKNMGRIWRVNAKTPKTQRAKLFRRDELIADLAHANGWVRATAQRMLLEDSGRERIRSALEPFLLKSTREWLELKGQFLALELLIAIAEPTDERLKKVLQRPPSSPEALATEVERSATVDPAHAVRVLSKLAQDSNPRVRFQCALSIGEMGENLRPLKTLTEVAERSPEDRWTRAAVLSSITGVEKPFLLEALNRESSAGAYNLLIRDASRMAASAASGDRAVLFARFQALKDPMRKLAAVAGIIEALGEKALPEDNKERNALFATAGEIANTAGEQLDNRLIAIEFLASARAEESLQPLLAALDPSQPIDLQKAAVQSLLKRRDAHIIARVLDPSRWQNLSPATREIFLSGFISNAGLLPLFLDELQSGAIVPNILSANQRRQLREHKDPIVRAAAEKFFASAESTDRMKVFHECKSVLDLKPAPRNGQQVFLRTCGACHRLDREGTPVGPDLFSIRNQPKESILLHIIVPDYEIVPGFTAYNVELQDGSSYSGLIISETDASLTLRLPGGVEQNILRTNVKSLQSSKISLMPAELEKTMTRQELADLLAYLKGE